MKFLRKQPLVRLDNLVVNIEYFQLAWYCDDESRSGHHVIAYRMYGADEPLKYVYPTKKAALAELDRLMAEIQVPVIDEDEDG